MSRVRKDILNGWKEIGGYVCRDIRTVERWEKYRGLPVRRVPGAGRATVYALISEVDEWLASAKIDESEDSAPAVSVRVIEPPPSLEDQPVPSPETVAVEPELPAVAIGIDAVADDVAASPSPAETPATVELPQPMAWRPRSLVTGIGVAAAIVLLTAVVWPLMVQARRGTSAENPTRGDRAALDAAGNRAAPSVPYRSEVPGVDDLYLSGVYFCEQRTPDSLGHALQNFTDAIAKDANYAPAYAGLANTYNLLREYSGMPDAEAYPKAKAAAERAIALDPRLPQAHASLGFIDFFWTWDSAAAESEFKTAIALDPASVLAHHWYGSMLTHQARYAEAIEQLELAQRLQPTSTAIVSTRALALGESGHRDEAVAMLAEILKDAPSATSPHNILGTLSLMEPRDIPRYLAETRRVAELRHDEEWLEINAASERAYRSGGEKAMWNSMLAFEKRAGSSGSDRAYQTAQAAAALGHPDQAFDSLFQLVKEHNPSVIGIYNDPTFQVLHRDPRFREVTAKIGLPPLPQKQ